MLAALHGALRKHHGTAARAFLAHLAEARREDMAGLLAMLAGMRDRFAAALPTNADVQVRHVARAFALAATAGEMATRWGVLPWPAGEASRAALAVMATWMDRRGGADAGEDGAALVRLRAFIAAHGATSSRGRRGAWKCSRTSIPRRRRAPWPMPAPSSAATGGTSPFQR
jgi:putative DNA primase/helicase